MQMSQSVSPTCAMNALLLGLDSKTATIRGKVMSLIYNLIQNKSSELIETREFEVLKGKLGKLYIDSSPEARSSCKNIIRYLVNQNIYTTSELESFLSKDAISKALKDSSGITTSVSGLNLNNRVKSRLMSSASTKSVKYGHKDSG